MEREPMEGRDTYQARWEAAADTPLAVYVPVHDGGYIAPKSGIVGRPVADDPDGAIEVYYEGNLYGAENLREWSDRVRCAADRLITRYPTVARARVARDTLIHVADYVPRTHAVTFLVPSGPAALALWLRVSDPR